MRNEEVRHHPGACLFHPSSGRLMPCHGPGSSLHRRSAISTHMRWGAWRPGGPDRMRAIRREIKIGAAMASSTLDCEKHQSSSPGLRSRGFGPCGDGSVGRGVGEENAPARAGRLSVRVIVEKLRLSTGRPPKPKLLEPATESTHRVT